MSTIYKATRPNIRAMTKIIFLSFLTAVSIESISLRLLEFVRFFVAFDSSDTVLNEVKE